MVTFSIYNGKLKIDEGGSSFRYINPIDTVSISSLYDKIVISTNIFTVSYRIGQITSIGGNAPASMLTGVVGQLQTLIQSITAPYTTVNTLTDAQSLTLNNGDFVYISSLDTVYVKKSTGLVPLVTNS